MPPDCGAHAVVGNAPPQGRQQWCERDGVVHGEHVVWHWADKVEWRVRWERGVPTGEWRSYYPDGAPASRTPFAEGLRHGVGEVWDADGQLRARFKCQHGAPIEPPQCWDGNGSPVNCAGVLDPCAAPLPKPAAERMERSGCGAVVGSWSGSFTAMETKHAVTFTASETHGRCRALGQVVVNNDRVAQTFDVIVKGRQVTVRGIQVDPIQLRNGYTPDEFVLTLSETGQGLSGTGSDASGNTGFTAAFARVN